MFLQNKLNKAQTKLTELNAVLDGKGRFLVRLYSSLVLTLVGFS